MHNLVLAVFAPSPVNTTLDALKKNFKMLMLQTIKSDVNHTSILITQRKTTKFWSSFLAGDEGQVENNLINTVAGRGRER